MAAAHDATSSAEGVGVSSLTWSHTCTGADRCLVVGVSLYDSAVVVSSVTYAGVAMTSVGSASRLNAKMHLWRLIAPATGANNIIVTLDAANDVVGGAESATGVDQTTPLGTFASATGSSTAPTVDVSAAADDLVVDTLGADSGATATVGAGQTQRWNRSGAPIPIGAGSTEPGAATVTMSWTLSAAGAWAIGCAALKAAAAAAPPLRTLTLLGVGA